jgi:4-carboxymuconolactone decarboxylase
MNKSRWLVVFILLISTHNMNAQNKTGNMSALDLKEQGIVSISALTASGGMERLKAALNAGLDAGLTVNQIKELLVQLYAYCGFPRSLNGINAFMTVLEERKLKGISDNRVRSLLLAVA